MNVLIYAYNASAPLHRAAAQWWEEQVNGGSSVGVCWPVFQGFIRLLGERHVVEQPYSSEELFAIADEWWARPSIRLLSATDHTYRHFRRLMEAHGLSGSMATDALIPAFALEHRGTLATNDTDFLRFRELSVVNPFDN